MMISTWKFHTPDNNIVEPNLWLNNTPNEMEKVELEYNYFAIYQTGNNFTDIHGLWNNKTKKNIHVNSENNCTKKLYFDAMQKIVKNQLTPLDRFICIRKCKKAGNNELPIAPLVHNLPKYIGGGGDGDGGCKLLLSKIYRLYWFVKYNLAMTEFMKIIHIRIDELWIPIELENLLGEFQNLLLEYMFTIQYFLDDNQQQYMNITIDAKVMHELIYQYELDFGNPIECIICRFIYTYIRLVV